MKNLGTIFIVIAAALLVGGMTWWQFRDWRQSLKEVEWKAPQFEIPEIEIDGGKNIEEREFLSEDGKLRLRYSSDWIELGNIDIFNQNIEEGEKVLLFAQKMKLREGAFAFLTVQEIELKESQTLAEIVEERKKEAEESEGTAEIVKTEVEKEAWLEAKYKKAEGITFYSKEKMILASNKVFSVAISSPEKDWRQFEKEAEEILDSVVALDKN